MKFLAAKVSVVVACVLGVTLMSSPSFAESHQQTKIEKSKKRKLYQVLDKRIRRHERSETSLSEVKTELLKALAKNYDIFRDRGALTDELASGFQQAELQLQGIDTKEELIRVEKETQKNLISAVNILCGCTRAMVHKFRSCRIENDMDECTENCCMTTWAVLTLPFDVAFFPITCLVSTATCFEYEPRECLAYCTVCCAVAKK